MGWMMVCWVMHLFPDYSLVYAATNLSLPQFLKDWTENVVIKLLTEPSDDMWHPSAGGYRSRKNMIPQARILSGERFDILRLCPGWPANTSNTTRDPKQAGKFFHQIYPVLRKFDPSTFITLSESAMKHVFLGERAVKPVLTERAVVIVEPTTNQLRVTQHQFFSLKQTELTRGHVNRIKADMPERTVRDIMGKYFRTDTERALQL
jgi:hypothetical protein